MDSLGKKKKYCIEIKHNACTSTKLNLVYGIYFLTCDIFKQKTRSESLV